MMCSRSVAAVEITVPQVCGALPGAAQRGKRKARQWRGRGWNLRTVILSRHPVGEQTAGVQAVGDAAALVANRVMHGSVVGCVMYMRQKVGGETYPSPPVVLDRDFRQRRQLALQFREQEFPL